MAARGWSTRRRTAGTARCVALLLEAAPTKHLLELARLERHMRGCTALRARRAEQLTACWLTSSAPMRCRTLSLTRRSTPGSPRSERWRIARHRAAVLIGITCVLRALLLLAGRSPSCGPAHAAEDRLLLALTLLLEPSCLRRGAHEGHATALADHLEVLFCHAEPLVTPPRATTEAGSLQVDRGE
jgi:hypothetical protein